MSLAWADSRRICRLKALELSVYFLYQCSVDVFRDFERQLLKSVFLENSFTESFQTQTNSCLCRVNVNYMFHFQEISLLSLYVQLFYWYLKQKP